MDEMQAKLCGRSLRTSARGRLDQRRMDTAMDEKCSQSGSQRKINYLFSTTRRKSSVKAIEPYVPPHRRIQAMADQNGVVELKQRDLKSHAPTTSYSNSEYKNNRENGYNYNDSISDYSSSSYKSRNFFDRKNSYQSIDANPRKNYQSIDNFLNFKKSFRFSNGTNQIEDNTDENNQIAERVLKIVDIHVNNGLKEILDGLYEQTYGESLPPELLSRWQFSVTLKNFPQNSTPYRKFPDSIKTVKFPSTTVPASLDFKRLKGEFWVNIHRCRNVSELWGIIMDTNHLGEVEKLSNQMQLFYEHLETPNDVIMNYSYYALLDGSWHRVQCLQYDDSNATVLFIDRGDEDIVPINKLHILSSQFCALPAQAIRMSLSGLEVFLDFNELQPILIHNLCDRTIFAEVDNVTEDYLCVQLYFNDDNDETININEMIVNHMLEKLLNPKLHIQSDKIVPAHISHLENKIFVQLDTPSYKYFNLLMEKALREYISNIDSQRQVVVRHEVNTIYFVKSNQDQNWYRGKIMKFINESEIQVYLIDIGSITETNRANVLYLEKVCSILAKYPAQAIEVQLDQIPILNSKMLTSLQNVISRSKDLYVKFVSVPDNNNLPMVHLMKKNQSDFMMSINDALLILDDGPSSKKSDGVVLALPRLPIDKSRNKTFDTSSMQSTKSSQNSNVQNRLIINKCNNKDLDTSSIQSAKSLPNSKLEPRLLTDKLSNKDFDTSSMQSTKSSQNSKIGPELLNHKFSNIDFGTLSMQSTKSLQNSQIGPELLNDKSSNMDFGTSSLQSTKLLKNSRIEPRLSSDQFSYTDFDTSSMQSTKSSQNSNMQSRLIINKCNNKDLDTSSIQSAKSLPNSKLEPRLLTDKLSNKIFDTSSMQSTKSSQNSQIGPELLNHKFSNIDFGTLSMQSTMSLQNSQIGPELLNDKSSNMDFGTSSLQSTKLLKNSRIEPRLPSDQFSYTDFDTSLILSTRLSQHSEIKPRFTSDKLSNKDFDALSMGSTKLLQNSKTEPKLSTDKISNKDFNTSSICSTETSQNSRVDLETGKEPMQIVENMMSKIREMHTVFTQKDGKYITMCLSSVLSAPKLPELYDYFDVQIVLASDPSHFVMQLLRTKTMKFKKMISKMSDTYRCYKGPTLTSESIKVGQVYACKSSRDDRDWCRAYVTEIKDKKMASVYCCDYGSYKTVDISNMVPLDNEFYRLPYQAIWAELNGVKPTSKEWTVRACLKFQELTQSKNFVSRVVSKKDAKSKTFQKPTQIPVTVEIIYCVDLIDTSSVEDIDIADLLIEGGVAERS